MGQSLAEWDRSKNKTFGHQFLNWLPRCSHTSSQAAGTPPEPTGATHSLDTRKQRKWPEHGEVIDLVGSAGDTDDNGLVKGISYQSIAAAYNSVQETGIA